MRLLVLAKAYETGMPQMPVWRPLNELDLSHYLWLNPAAVLHLFSGEAFAPTSGSLFGEINERAFRETCASTGSDLELKMGRFRL